ncbi:MAG: phage holin family protein [Calditrichia bacterium]
MILLLKIGILSLAIFLVARIMPSVHIKSYGTAVIVAIVYSFINLLLGWLFTLISFPLIVITFGLFKFVINAALLWITDQLIDDFRIDSFGSTLLAALLITIIDSALKWMVF